MLPPIFGLFSGIERLLNHDFFHRKVTVSKIAFLCTSIIALGLFCGCGLLSRWHGYEKSWQQLCEGLRNNSGSFSVGSQWDLVFVCKEVDMMCMLFRVVMSYVYMI